MLLQLHAQNPDNTSQTTLLSQLVIGNEIDFENWATDLYKKWFDMESQRPEGWIPLVVTEQSDLFWREPVEGNSTTQKGES